MREITVEAYYKKVALQYGGDSYKFKSPGRRSIPDQITFFDNGLVLLAEIKQLGKKPTPAQKREHDRFRARGFTVGVIDSQQAVNDFFFDVFTKGRSKTQLGTGLTNAWQKHYKNKLEEFVDEEEDEERC